MAASAPAQGADVDVTRPPRPSVLWTIALAGAAAAAGSYALTLASDDEYAPHVHAELVGWITLSYVVCGLEVAL